MIKKIKSGYVLSLLVICGTITTAQIVFAAELGQFKASSDIGRLYKPGKTHFDQNDQVYTLAGYGTSNTSSKDSLHFVWQRLDGDFIVRTRVELNTHKTHKYSKFGLSVRKELDPDSAQVSVLMDGLGQTFVQFRKNDSAHNIENKLARPTPDTLQIERKGKQFILSTASFGQPLVHLATKNIELTKPLYVGLSLNASNPGAMSQVTFSNVRIIKPAAPDFTPYSDYIGSKLEVMEIATGRRKVLLNSDDSLQAPNWTRDGKAFIYNSKGLLYRFDLTTKTPSVLNTGFATRNNNDHVLSWDGNSLAISHHDAEDNNRSVIYTLPIDGSDQPQRITRKGVGHSFLHGYSPNDRDLVFTGERNNQYDIWKVNINSGLETQLTHLKSLDDGAEYTPDGKFIYFNSARTGSMEIWRMNNDGSNQVQITADKYNNWFPHISPDGKWMVMLSFDADVNPNDHPFYRQVYLRLKPLDRDDLPKVIAYVYGGQGTINVASWSPDSKNIAFISNTATHY